MKPLHFIVVAIGLLLLCSVGARAESYYIDPAFNDQTSYCWDSTFNMWTYCSPIDWGTNPDPNGGGGTTDCPKATNLDSCIKNCDCVWQNNKKQCGTNVTCQDTAASEHNACLGSCAADWPS